MSINGIVKLSQNESVEHALRRLKKLLDQGGHRRDLRRHESFLSPSQTRRSRKAAAARRRTTYQRTHE